jgi:glycosyltransferase involved in cell wall biosynthesis
MHIKKRPATVIHLMGNVNNNFLLLANILTEFLDNDIRIYLKKDVFMETPQHDFYHDSKYERITFVYVSNFRFFSIKFMPFLAKYFFDINFSDIVIFSGDFVSLSTFLDASTIFYPTGYDLTRGPFLWSDFISSVKFMKMRNISKILKNINFVIYQYWHAKGIKQSKLLLSKCFLPFYYAYKELGVLQTDRCVDAYLPWAISEDVFLHFRSSLSNDAISLINQDVDTIKVFMPARLFIAEVDELRPTGLWKNLGIAIEGFAEAYHRINSSLPLVLYLIDRNSSPDISIARSKINQLKIDNAVRWLVPKDRRGFSRPEMMNLYGAMDIVMDDFGAGWFGGVALEALIAECIVINNVSPHLMTKLYGENPFYFATNSKDIANHIIYFAENPAEMHAAKLFSREWINGHHSASDIYQAFLKVLKCFPSRKFSLTFKATN